MKISKGVNEYWLFIHVIVSAGFKFELLLYDHSHYELDY